ncbi:DUF3040 domain-containing protein [Gryllotalpicola reticulitermitis]|uniref:DUF3040 domain-containing protein n=1 Tax=Gryllotalpicola reticulitermitis TaxID=1184153 RepID=A0ABV8QBV4_9MICO
MPLSEHEQRLLDEMERNLYQNDADFVANISQTPRRKPAYRAIVLGVLVAVIGVGALITGVTVRQPLVGILGFVLMFAGVLFAITPGRRRKDEAVFEEPAAGSSSPNGQRGRQKNSSDFMDRLGERWDKRQDGDR